MRRSQLHIARLCTAAVPPQRWPALPCPPRARSRGRPPWLCLLASLPWSSSLSTRPTAAARTLRPFHSQSVSRVGGRPGSQLRGRTPVLGGPIPARHAPQLLPPLLLLQACQWHPSLPSPWAAPTALPSLSLRCPTLQSTTSAPSKMGPTLPAQSRRPPAKSATACSSWASRTCMPSQSRCAPAWSARLPA